MSLRARTRAHHCVRVEDCTCTTMWVHVLLTGGSVPNVPIYAHSPHYLHTMSTLCTTCPHICTQERPHLYMCTHARSAERCPAHVSTLGGHVLPYPDTVGDRHVTLCPHLDPGVVKRWMIMGGESHLNSIINDCDLRHIPVKTPWYYWAVEV